MATARALQRLAGLGGASAVGLAAYGAHALQLPPDFKRSFDNGNRMHLIHSAVLVAAPSFPRPLLTGSLFAMGILAFSGSCYVVAFTQDKKYGKLAPVGGITLMAAWLTLLI